jgi:hypothetical protein
MGDGAIEARLRGRWRFFCAAAEEGESIGAAGSACAARSENKSSMMCWRHGRWSAFRQLGLRNVDIRPRIALPRTLDYHTGRGMRRLLFELTRGSAHVNLRVAKGDLPLLHAPCNVYLANMPGHLLISVQT